MLNRNQFYRAEQRHAQFYMQRLQAACDVYRQGGQQMLQALADLDTIWEQVQNALSWAAANREEEGAALLTSRIPDAGAELLALRMAQQEYINCLLLALETAGRGAPDEGPLRMRLLFALTSAYLQTGAIREVIDPMREAMELARELGDRVSESRALMQLGNASSRLGDLPAAEEAYLQCLEVSRELDDLNGMASSLNNLATTYSQRAEYATARRYLEEALELRRRQQNLSLLAGTLSNLGSALLGLNELAAARDAWQESLELRRKLGDQYGTALTLNNLGAAHTGLGETAAALACWEECLRITREKGLQLLLSAVLNNLGSAARDRGDYAAALDDYYRPSLEIGRSINHQYGVADCLCNMAYTYLALGETAAAETHLQEALQIARALPSAAIMLLALMAYAQVALMQGQAARAAYYTGAARSHAAHQRFDLQRRLAALDEKLAAVLPPETLAAEQARGQQEGYEAAATALLAG